MIHVHEDSLSDGTKFVMVEHNDESSAFFEGDYDCLKNHLINIGVDEGNAESITETYKYILKNEKI